MTAEQRALSAIDTTAPGSWVRDTLLYLLGEFIEAVYATVGQNVTRKLRLQRLQQIRTALDVAITDVLAGKEPTR